MLTPVVSALQHYYNNAMGDLQGLACYFILPILNIKLLRHDTSIYTFVPFGRLLSENYIDFFTAI